MNHGQLLAEMLVDVPPGVSGDVEIRQFVVSRAAEQAQMLRVALTGDQRMCPAGTYTALYRYGQLWMSDTPDERTDSLICLCHAAHIGARTALVNGLGLGSVLRGLMAIGIATIDVVEIDPDVIALVGPTCMRLAVDRGVELRIHQGDAYTIVLDGRWDVVWSDVWEYSSIANLDDMDRLVRRYRGRCDWHGQWARELILDSSVPSTYFCGRCLSFGRPAMCVYQATKIVTFAEES